MKHPGHGRRRRSRNQPLAVVAPSTSTGAITPFSASAPPAAAAGPDQKGNHITRRQNPLTTLTGYDFQQGSNGLSRTPDRTSASSNQGGKRQEDRTTILTTPINNHNKSRRRRRGRRKAATVGPSITTYRVDSSLCGVQSNGQEALVVVVEAPATTKAERLF